MATILSVQFQRLCLEKGADHRQCARIYAGDLIGIQSFLENLSNASVETGAIYRFEDRKHSLPQQAGERARVGVEHDGWSERGTGNSPAFCERNLGDPDLN